MDTRRFNFTRERLKDIPFANAGTRTVYHDTARNAYGLQLRVSATAKTFIVQKRVNGKPERVRLGTVDDLSIDDARRKAAEIAGIIAKGESPAAQRRRAKLETKTLGQALEDYIISRKTLKPRTISDMHSALREFCPDWMGKPLVRITPDALKKRHQKHGEERSAARANLACRYLRALFNFAAAEYQDDEGRPLVNVNPVDRIRQTRAWFQVDGRTGRVNRSELKTWTGAVMNLPSEDIKDLLVTLVLTALRRQEALDLRWSDVNLNEGTLVINDPKNRRRHLLPMGDYLRSLMNRRKAVAVSEFVFADQLGRRVRNLRYALDAIEKAVGRRITPHDLRRTVSSVCTSLNFNSYAIKKVMNHVTGDITFDYTWLELQEMRERMQLIEDFILGEAGIKPNAAFITLQTIQPDFWVQEQTELIKQGRFDAVDKQMLIKALENFAETSPANVISLVERKRQS